MSAHSLCLVRELMMKRDEFSCYFGPLLLPLPLLPASGSTGGRQGQSVCRSLAVGDLKLTPRNRTSNCHHCLRRLHSGLLDSIV